MDFNYNGKGMLRLPIKKKWFDMILSGEKKEEYREIKLYWTARINNYIMKFYSKPFNHKTKYMFGVIFQNGYSKNAPYFVATCILKIGKGKKEWGAIPNKSYYVFEIQSIVEKGNI